MLSNFMDFDSRTLDYLAKPKCIHMKNTGVSLKNYLNPYYKKRTKNWPIVLLYKIF